MFFMINNYDQQICLACFMEDVLETKYPHLLMCAVDLVKTSLETKCDKCGNVCYSAKAIDAAEKITTILKET